MTITRRQLKVGQTYKEINKEPVFWVKRKVLYIGKYEVFFKYYDSNGNWEGSMEIEKFLIHHIPFVTKKTSKEK